ncbi:hypothetical protein GOBAR_DD28922 [Gossypium barbadense]|nr:hypothetical protein GOBAR_DD28922 [Gossypium barbadense]
MVTFRAILRGTIQVPTLTSDVVLKLRLLIYVAFNLQVRPGTQPGQKVDIISIDFSDKLLFRLKLPMVKAAIKVSQRGIYFEITYSDLIVDVHQMRQIISNAKLRGPNDVANLAYLLGLSMERAKAVISKNCRSLLTNALRRKHFFKEAIRVEAVSSSINLWDLEISNQSFNIVDVKPANMEDLTVKPILFWYFSLLLSLLKAYASSVLFNIFAKVMVIVMSIIAEVIASAEFHPTHCNMLAYSSSKGSIRLIDLRHQLCVILMPNCNWCFLAHVMSDYMLFQSVDEIMKIVEEAKVAPRVSRPIRGFG